VQFRLACDIAIVRNHCIRHICCSQQSELYAQIPDGHRTRQRVRDTILPEDRRPAEKDWQAHVAAAQKDRKEQNGRLEELQAG